MRGNSNIMMLIAAILAFLPVLTVEFVLDGFVRNRELAQIQRSVNNVANDAQASVYEAIDIMSAVIAESNSVCTPNFLKLLRQKMQLGRFIRQVQVESTQGVPYCDAVGASMEFEVVSGELPIPGRAETLAAVLMSGADVPMFRITQTIDRNRRISAFVDFSHVLTEGRLPSEIRFASAFCVCFTDDTSLVKMGDAALYSEGENLVAKAFAGELPIQVEVTIPFEIVRAGYAELYFSLMLIACVFSAGILFIVLQLTRKSRFPTIDLEHAITGGEIRPFYQPVIDLSTGQVSGCEVLARWVKPNGDIISPAAFIEYAEVTGLAIPMTIKLMESVRNDLAELSKSNPDLKISINLFEGHFRDGSVIEDIQAIFGDSGVSYRQLIFEITERFPLENDEQTSSVITGLHALGCRLALDDVGTGHSNLSFVQTLGMDVIKIDRVFVKAITEETVSAPVLDSLITMAQNLGAGIVAEGVETQAQAIYLRSKGVTQVQGYLFSPALTALKYLKMVGVLNNSADLLSTPEQRAA